MHLDSHKRGPSSSCSAADASTPVQHVLAPTREEVAQQPLEQGDVLIQELWQVDCSRQATTVRAHCQDTCGCVAQVLGSCDSHPPSWEPPQPGQVLVSISINPLPRTIVDGPQHQHILWRGWEGALEVAGSRQHSRHSPHAKVVVLLAGQLLAAQPALTIAHASDTYNRSVSLCAMCGP